MPFAACYLDCVCSWVILVRPFSFMTIHPQLVPTSEVLPMQIPAIEIGFAHSKKHLRAFPLAIATAKASVFNHPLRKWVRFVLHWSCFAAPVEELNLPAPRSHFRILRD